MTERPDLLSGSRSLGMFARLRARCTLVGLVPLGVWACGDEAVVPLEGLIALEVVTADVVAPVDLAAPPGDPTRLFVLEKPGRVRVVRDGTLLTEPFLDIASGTSAEGERGLLGIAFHPEYAVNGYVFLHHSDLAGDTHVVRYTAQSADRADPSSATTILRVEQPFSNHNGGQIVFGHDGMLYVALGDGGSGGDPLGHGQNPGTLLGAILRLDVDGGQPYAVPADNPFVATAGAAPEIWAYGLRNPWRISFDRANGDLWIGDVGQRRFEEISVQPGSSAGGENFGWNVTEGSACFATDPCQTIGLSPPVYVYDHDEGCSVTGGYVYRGEAIPELRGRYLFGDFCSGFVRSFRMSGGEATEVQDHSADLGSVGGLAAFGEDLLGELYLLDLGGVVYRLVPAG